MDAQTVNLALAQQAFKVSKNAPRQWKILTDFLAERVGADEATKLVRQVNIEHIITSIRRLLSDTGITFGRVVIGKRDGTYTGDLEKRMKKTWEQVVTTVNALLESDEDYFKKAAIEGLIQGLKDCVQWQYSKEEARQFFTELALKDISRLQMSAAELRKRCGF